MFVKVLRAIRPSWQPTWSTPLPEVPPPQRANADCEHAVVVQPRELEAVLVAVRADVVDVEIAEDDVVGGRRDRRSRRRRRS